MTDDEIRASLVRSGYSEEAADAVLAEAARRRKEAAPPSRRRTLAEARAGIQQRRGRDPIDGDPRLAPIRIMVTEKHRTRWQKRAKEEGVISFTQWVIDKLEAACDYGELTEGMSDRWKYLASREGKSYEAFTAEAVELVCDLLEQKPQSFEHTTWWDRAQAALAEQGAQGEQRDQRAQGGLGRQGEQRTQGVASAPPDGEDGDGWGGRDR